MLERLRREVWKWMHVIAAMIVFTICVGSMFVPIIIDGWLTVLVAGVSFAVAFYILKHN